MPLRIPYNDSRMGQAKSTKRRSSARGLMLHFTSDIDATLGLGLGYHAIAIGGVVWLLAEPEAVVSHCKGYNTSHIGVSIATEGLRHSEVEGSVRAYHRKQQRWMWQRRYEVDDLEAMAHHCAKLLRDYCGGADAEVLGHDEVNAAKNDPGPAFPRQAWTALVRRLAAGDTVEREEFEALEPELYGEEGP